jgi:hypothetical protein
MRDALYATKEIAVVLALSLSLDIMWLYTLFTRILEMSGYDWGAGMSNRAVAAYDKGLLPASKIKGVPASLIAAHCSHEEWHHASKAFNAVKFYKPEYVLATFGVALSDTYSPSPGAVAALAAHKAEEQSERRFENQRVDWIEWVGSLKHAKAIARCAIGCVVVVKGATAKVTLPGGQVMSKRVATRGFMFSAAQ